VNLETEIPEILFEKMKNFIETRPDLDQYIFITSALNNFLFKNGCEDRRIAENYLKDVFDQSLSNPI
tara:strand:+ start:8568 stop:8768 length:201 start_codon:yes stop_codon:yes gene_type:complete